MKPNQSTDDKLGELLYPLHKNYCVAADMPEDWRKDWYKFCDCPVKEAKADLHRIMVESKIEALQKTYDLVESQYGFAIKEERLSKELRHGGKWFLYNLTLQVTKQLDKLTKELEEER